MQTVQEVQYRGPLKGLMCIDQGRYQKLSTSLHPVMKFRVLIILSSCRLVTQKSNLPVNYNQPFEWWAFTGKYSHQAQVMRHLWFISTEQNPSSSFFDPSLIYASHSDTKQAQYRSHNFHFDCVKPSTTNRGTIPSDWDESTVLKDKPELWFTTASCTMAATETGGIVIVCAQLLQPGRMTPSWQLKKTKKNICCNEEKDENYHTRVQRKCEITATVWWLDDGLFFI